MMEFKENTENNENNYSTTNGDKKDSLITLRTPNGVLLGRNLKKPVLLVELGYSKGDVVNTDILCAFDEDLHPSLITELDIEMKDNTDTVEYTLCCYPLYSESNIQSVFSSYPLYMEFLNKMTLRLDGLVKGSPNKVQEGVLVFKEYYKRAKREKELIANIKGTEPIKLPT